MFAKIRYRYVYNRKHRLNAAGRALLQLECRLRQQRIYLSTSVYLLPTEWDGNYVVNSPLASDLNAYLAEQLIAIQRIELSFVLRGKSPTLAMLREAVRSHATPSALLADFIASVNAHSPTRGKSTRAAYDTLIRAIDRFQPATRLEDITIDFLNRFTDHQRSLGISQSTIAARLKSIHAIIREAIARHVITADDDPFRFFRIPRIEQRRDFLTIDELARLERLPLTGREAYVRDVALFAAYTGLRFSDLNAVTSRNIFTERGKTWLVVTPRKTAHTSAVTVRLPLYALFGGKAVALIARYKTVEQLAHVGNNAAANRTLKAIVQKLGISPDRRITFHSLRHSFVSNCIAQGIPITTVQLMAGHTKITMTAGYTHTEDTTVKTDVERAFGKSKKRHSGILSVAHCDTQKIPTEAKM